MNHNDQSLDSRLLQWGGAILGTFMVAAFAASIAHAQPHAGHRRAPPPEAFAACNDRGAADPC